MEKELNIAAILKDKPNAKLWSPIVGNCTFKGFSSKNGAIVASFVDKDGELLDWYFNEYGKTFYAPKEAEVCLFPSKSMRDWEKLSWKKGDVLIGDCGFVCIFKEWASDDYTKFNGCYFDGMPNAETAKYSKLDNNTAYGYIREIENRCGGKLNLETLEIEKQPNFKDGDIVALVVRKCTHIAIFQSRQEKYIGFHAVLCQNDELLLEEPFREDDGDIELRPATDEERQRLFDALAKGGKRWNPDTLQIEDLPKKCEFKTFDKCVWKVQGFEGAIWQASFISYVDEYDAVPIGVSSYDLSNLIVLPYNEQTKHLLGTTDEWKGGEG